MGCKFCASTGIPFGGNLSSGQIIEQLLEVEKDTGSKISNIVFMGIDVVRTFSTQGIVSGVLVLAMIVFSLMNFLLYFFFTRKKMGISGVTFKQRKRKVQYKQKVSQAQAHNTYANGARHKCAICGRTDLDNPELSFRFCSKCSGNKEYCEDHLFTHEHN